MHRLFLSTIYSSFLAFFHSIPLMHWVIMGVLSLLASSIILFRKKYKPYSSFILALAVFTVFFLLDIAVVIRFSGVRVPNPGLDLCAEYDRLIRLVHGNERLRILLFFNMAVFVPFGFFLSEFLTETNLCNIKYRLGFVTLFGFGLSLCIECFQLAFHVGFFELTDLVLNTLGTFIGVMLSFLFHRLFRIT